MLSRVVTFIPQNPPTAAEPARSCKPPDNWKVAKVWGNTRDFRPLLEASGARWDAKGYAWWYEPQLAHHRYEAKRVLSRMTGCWVQFWTT